MIALYDRPAGFRTEAQVEKALESFVGRLRESSSGYERCTADLYETLQEALAIYRGRYNDNYENGEDGS